MTPHAESNIKAILRVEPGVEKSLTLTVRLFSCPHFRVLSTAASLWCHGCGRESADSHEEDYGGYMDSKVATAIEFTLTADDDVRIVKLI